MKKSILFLLLAFCLFDLSQAQEQPPYDRTRQNTVLDDRSTWARNFLGVPHGASPSFPGYVPDSLKAGSIYYSTTAHQDFYYNGTAFVPFTDTTTYLKVYSGAAQKVNTTYNPATGGYGVDFDFFGHATADSVTMYTLQVESHGSAGGHAGVKIGGIYQKGYNLVNEFDAFTLFQSEIQLRDIRINADVAAGIEASINFHDTTNATFVAMFGRTHNTTFNGSTDLGYTVGINGTLQVTSGINANGLSSGTAAYAVQLDGAGNMIKGAVTTSSGGTLGSFGFTNANGFTGSVSNPTTSPVLSLSLQNATASADGQLSHTDWNTFNAKQAALGFTPYNSTNPAGYISGITSSNVTTALGFTPYNATNPAGYISGITSSNVTAALGFTPYNASNPTGYISGITSSNVTAALGFTPYNASNPAGYISTIAPTAVTAGSYTNTNITVGADGRITAASSGSGGSGGTLSSFAFTNGAGFTGTVANASTTPTLSLTLQNATTSLDGQLSHTDWNTFNGKITSPMTTLGDVMYGGTSGAVTRLAGQSAFPVAFLAQSESGGTAAAPVWYDLFGQSHTWAGNQTFSGIETITGTLTVNSPSQISLTTSGANVFSSTGYTQIIADSIFASSTLASNDPKIMTQGADGYIHYLAKTSLVGSVTNSDGSLTFANTAGAVTGSLNTGHANTWLAALQTFQVNGIGATAITDGILINNTTAAAAGSFQNSPVLDFGAPMWTGSASVPTRWTLGSVGTNATSTFNIGFSSNGGAFTNFLSFNSYSGTAAFYQGVTGYTFTASNSVITPFLRSSSGATLSIGNSSNTTALTAVTVTGAAGSITNSTGLYTSLAVAPTVNQTGSASSTGFLITPYFQGVGSGIENVFDFGYNSAANAGGTHSSLLRMDNTGHIFMNEANNKFISQTTLVAGTKVLSIPGITSSSRCVSVTLASQGGTTSTTAAYEGVCSTGTLTINAVTSAGTNTINTSDTSTITYVVIN